MGACATLYFDKGGREHSNAVLEAVKDRVANMDPKPEAIVVTSTSGETALKAAHTLQWTGVRIIAAPFQRHLWKQYAGLDPNFAEECRQLGVEFLPDEPKIPLLDNERPDIVNAWRVVSQGFKVAVQVASMCVDTGLLDDGALVVATGGSSWGADTAVAVETRGYEHVLESNVVEIIAMPRR